MRAIVRGILIPLVLIAGFLGGVIALGNAATEDLRRHDVGTIAFADVQCDAPGPLAIVEFLREVQYETGIPDRIDLLADDWQESLADAFRHSAWVEEVTAVGRISNPSGSEIHVNLRFRQPVLAISTPEGFRAVDRHQVLLPRATPTDGLPVLRTADAVQSVPSGSVLDDPAVTSALRSLAALPPDVIGELAVVEVNNGDVILWTAAGKRITPNQPADNRPMLVQAWSRVRDDK